MRLIGVNDQIWIDFTLPQQQALAVEGKLIQVRINGSAPSFPASIIGQDVFVNAVSRNVRFRAIADNTKLGLQPGSLLHVEVPVGKMRNVTLVPNTAVRRDSFGASVYVLKSAEAGARAEFRAEERQVKPGAQRDAFVVITKGLQVGERIAGVGAFKLRDGILVRAVKPTPLTVSGD